MTSLQRADWNIEISWVKAHVGIVVNELADRLAKAAMCDSAAKIVFNRFPMNTQNYSGEKNGNSVQRPV